MNGANVLYVNVNFAQMSCTCASILMSSEKWNLMFFAVVELSYKENVHMLVACKS